jgi:molybdopterin converting factor small subunit
MKVILRSTYHLKEALGGRMVEIDLPEGMAVRGLLSRMVEMWGDKLSPLLFEPGTDLLLPHIRLMVNGQAVEFLNGPKTVLKEGDEVLVLFPAAGG